MKAAPLLEPNVEHTDELIIEALKKLRYPVLASLKLDGIRAIRLQTLRSCRMHMIPNDSIRQRAIKFPAGFDMELFNPELSYDEIESIVMSREHERSDLIQFHLIDWYQEHMSYVSRTQKMYDVVYGTDWTDTFYPTLALCKSWNQLFDYFIRCENEAGEGICFRLPNSPYKQGRSTLIEQYLVKLCRYIRTEVKVIAFEEQMLNTNKLKVSKIGLTERASHQHNKIGKGTLGAFIVQNERGQTFRVGTGVNLTEKRRQQIWDTQAEWMNSFLTIKMKPHGEKIKPRHPIAILEAEYVGPRKEGF